MKPEFSNLEIDFWLHEGKLGRAKPFLCLFHPSLEVGSQILDPLHELKRDRRPTQRKLTFVRCHRDRPLTTLLLKVVSANNDLQVMNVRCSGENAAIEMTDEGLRLLTDAVAKWFAGSEDFGVSPRHSSLTLGELDLGSGELWFWGPGYSGP